MRMMARWSAPLALLLLAQAQRPSTAQEKPPAPPLAPDRVAAIDRISSDSLKGISRSSPPTCSKVAIPPLEVSTWPPNTSPPSSVGRDSSRGRRWLFPDRELGSPRAGPDRLPVRGRGRRPVDVDRQGGRHLAEVRRARRPADVDFQARPQGPGRPRPRAGRRQGRAPRGSGRAGRPRSGVSRRSWGSPGPRSSS